ncbi:hypothetical protein [Henriciella pelagia]|jgi:cytochrome c biogenesis protein CcdA|uniref:Heme exporter protein D n=1 Tax=Henriciella pelagia TaxID=1977912 RepID=A0ABQ1JIU5_9PROT|nr:hypothetical protein [Henriciella pelagia]GGB69539.1 hypothetical protein GCM10011503_17700 [Henriciella pelagia]
MLPTFDDNAAFIWTIYAIGLAVPVLLLIYASLRARASKAKLEKLRAEKAE